MDNLIGLLELVVCVDGIVTVMVAIWGILEWRALRTSSGRRPFFLIALFLYCPATGFALSFWSGDFDPNVFLLSFALGCACLIVPGLGITNNNKIGIGGRYGIYCTIHDVAIKRCIIKSQTTWGAIKQVAPGFAGAFFVFTVVITLAMFKILPKDIGVKWLVIGLFLHLSWAYVVACYLHSKAMKKYQYERR